MRTSPALACLLLVGAALAQEPASRRPLFGRVLGSGGPIAGATVTLIGFDSHFDPRRDAADVVTAVADQRGQFRASVQVALPYCGFACGPVDATGAIARSDVQGWFGAGALVDFHCAAPDGPHRVQVVGAEAWAGDGPLEWWARPCQSSEATALPRAWTLPIDRDGCGTWPALPLGNVELATAAGGPLWLARIPPAPSFRVVVPPPRELQCRVVDERGAAVAGAGIYLRLATLYDGMIDGVATTRGAMERLVGRSGADGTATLRLPLAVSVFATSNAENVVCTARAPGRVERTSGFQGRFWLRDDHRVEPDGGRELRFTLPPAQPLVGSVRFGQFATEAGATVRLFGVAKLHGSGRSYTHDPRSYDGVVGADGTFAIDGVPDDLHSSELVLIRRNGESVECTGCLPGTLQPGVVDLAAMARLRLSVLDARDGPAGGKAVYLCEIEPAATSRRGRPRRHCVDPAGRAEFSLCAGQWFVFCADATGCGWGSVRLGAGDSTALQVRMQPYPIVRGALVDDAGSPVARARISLRGIKVDSSAGRDPAGDLARSLLRSRLQQLLATVATGGDGAFAIPFLPLDNVTITVRLVGDGRRTDDFALRSGVGQLDLRWQ